VAANARVLVEGLDETIRAFARVDKALAGELRKELRTRVGGEFVRDVKSRISGEGLVDRGKLRASIRPAVRGSTLVVRSSPPLRPGPKSRLGYAAIYEHGRGRRPFLEPTLDQWAGSGKAEEQLDSFLEWMESEWGVG
jgi:hypothetical protein